VQHFVSVFAACTVKDLGYVTNSRIQNVTNIWCCLGLFSWSESPNTQYLTGLLRCHVTKAPNLPRNFHMRALITEKVTWQVTYAAGCFLCKKCDWEKSFYYNLD